MESVYHEGERFIQELMGVRSKSNSLRSMIKPHMSNVAVEFLKSLNFSVISFTKDNKELFCSIVYGFKPFIKTINTNEILIDLSKKTFIPKHIIDSENLNIGFLGLDFENKMRIRINGKGKIKDNFLYLKIEQVYSNCPRYIDNRKLIGKIDFNEKVSISEYSKFNQKSINIIENANTFFISTNHIKKGSDVSHKGGKKGFLKLNSSTQIEFDDFPGNNMYNTLGNINKNPNVCIIIIDFEENKILHIIGTATIIDELKLNEKKLKVIIDCTNIRIETNNFFLKYDK